MDAALALLFLLVAGVNFGWQPAKNSTDGYEYIVQVEPELLDGLRRGESAPIESHVPPEVGPIQKISIVVGHGDLPRDTVSAVQRTAYFAGQASLTPDQYNAPAGTSTYDRYGQLPATTSPTGVAPPPGVMDRAQTAVTETGNALRDGVEAGIAAANQQFSSASNQVMDATRNAGQEFSQQLQSFANDPIGQMQSATNSVRATTEQALGATSNQTPQVSNPFSVSSPQAAPATQSQRNVAPPPWPQAPSQALPAATASSLDQTAARGMGPTRTESGWTSIGSNVAAPPLIIPQSQSIPANPASAPMRVASSGPSFPASSWDGNNAAPPATIGLSGSLPPAGNTARDLVPVQQTPGQTQPTQQAASSWDDPWARDPWGQSPPPPPTTAGQASQDPRYNPPAVRDAAASWQMGNAQPTLIPSQSTNQTIGGNLNGGVVGVGSTIVPQTGTGQSVTAEQPPWLPLLLVSLSLMGSLSANLFLGWSYLDARQKYRSLVRKTADTFRRVTNAAA